MKYQYRFKSKELYEAVSVIFGKEYVEKELQRQMPDEFDYFILETADHNKVNSSALIPKEEVEHTRVYDPNDWNPFPKMRPPKQGDYFVFLNRDYDCRVRIDYYTKDPEDEYEGFQSYGDNDVLAFRALNISEPSESEL